MHPPSSSGPLLPLTIRRVDPTAAADLAQLNALAEACDRARFGACEVLTPAQRAERLASTEYWEQMQWVAEAETMEGGSSVVGIASLQLPLHENTETAFAGLETHPAFRGQGVAGALITQALAPAIEESGRSLVTSWGEIPGEGELDDASFPANRLAARWGLTRTTAAICRTLDLPLDPALLDALDAEAAARIGDYRIWTWSDEVPEEHLVQYGRLQTQLELDDPDEDTVYEAADYTPERIRYGEARDRRMGKRSIISVAVAPDGTFAGNSEVEFQEGEGTDLGWQENTLVMPEHRGHRLGLALKVSTHRRLAGEAPGLRRLATWNSHVNPWMIAINEKLGYRPAFREITYQGAVPRTDLGD